MFAIDVSCGLQRSTGTQTKVVLVQPCRRLMADTCHERGPLSSKEERTGRTSGERTTRESENDDGQARVFRHRATAPGVALGRHPGRGRGRLRYRLRRGPALRLAVQPGRRCAGPAQAGSRAAARVGHTSTDARRWGRRGAGGGQVARREPGDRGGCRPRRRPRRLRWWPPCRTGPDCRGVHRRPRVGAARSRWPGAHPYTGGQRSRRPSAVRLRAAGVSVVRRRRSPRGRVHHLGRQRAWPRRARPCVAAEAAAALADKRTGAAGEALEQLRALGINVRDRGQAQQYRKV